MLPVGLMIGSSSVGRRFFFSSRRRHTRSLSDWSSDVCSSDLNVLFGYNPDRPVLKDLNLDIRPGEHVAVRSEERRVGKSVDLGGRRIIKKKKRMNRWSSLKKKKIKR